MLRRLGIAFVCLAVCLAVCLSALPDWARAEEFGAPDETPPAAEASGSPEALLTPDPEAVGSPEALLTPDPEVVDTPEGGPAPDASEESGAVPQPDALAAVAATGVALDHTALTLLPGEQALLTATVAPAEAGNREVVWRSSDESVATVVDGLVAAVGVGQADIIAQTRDGGHEAVCRVVVWRAVESISPLAAVLSLGVGEKRAISCGYAPEDATAEFSYSSSDQRVAKVSADGVVTAARTGSAVVTIKDKNGATARITVKVWKAPKAVSLRAARNVIGVGETLALDVGFSKGYGGGYAFISSDEAVAAIDGNNVVALSPGTSKITVRTYNGVTKAGKLTVLPAPQSVALDRTELALGAGDAMILTWTLSAGSAGEVAFSTGDAGVATVDRAGKVRAVGAGTTEVRIRTYNGHEAVCAVTVLPAPKSVSLTAPGNRKAIGTGERMMLAWAFDEGSAGSVTFSSSNTRYVTVDAQGVVTGKRAGSATVTVRTHNGLTAKVKFTVLKTPKSVSLGAARKLIGVGETLALDVGFSKGYGGGYAFISSDEAVAAIDGDNVVALSPGTSKITVRTYNGVTKAGTLTVLPAPQSVSLDRTELALGTGDAMILTWTLSAGSAGAVSFSTGDAGVATVDRAGKVRAVGAGTTEIWVRTYNGHEAACAVTVLPAPKAVSLRLPEGSAHIGVGEKLTLQTILSPEGSAASVTYKSSNTRYVTVNAQGIVTGKRAGSAVIYATTHNGKKAKLTVTVKKAPDAVTVSLDRTLLGVGEEARCRSKLSSGSAGRVSFASSDENIARVEGDRVIAVSPGSVVITATAYNGKSRGIALQVAAAPESIQISPDRAVVGAGDRVTLFATLPESSAGAYAFASSDVSVAVVDAATGLVRAVAVGEVTITVTAYSGASASARVKVVAAPAELTFGSPAADAGGAYKIELDKRGAFQIAPDLGEMTSFGLTFKSSNSSVASVSASGLVTARATGSCAITATAYNGASALIRVTVTNWVDRLDSDYVAHAMGGLDGKVYTNSLEAFLSNYALGCRVFECDFSWTSDGQLVLWHSWEKNRINAETPLGFVPALAEFQAMKIDGRYTPLTYRDLLRLMEEYPDAHFLLDTKVRTPEAAKEMFGCMRETAVQEDSLDALDRMIAYVYSEAIYRAIDEVYHFNRYVYGLYLLEKAVPSTARFEKIAQFCAKNGIDMIAMVDSWWNTKYLAAMKKSDVAVEVHTVNSASQAKKLLAAGVSWICTDWLLPSAR